MFKKVNRNKFSYCSKAPVFAINTDVEHFFTNIKDLQNREQKIASQKDVN